MKKIINRVAGLTLILFCASAVLLAQVTSRVTGLVQDKTGAMIPNAAVTLTNEATNVPLTTKTTSAGSYLFDGVQPGIYKVMVGVKGFQTYISKGNVLTIGQPMVVNATLQVGAVGQEMEVSAGAQEVQTDTSGNFGTLIDQESVKTLPIVGTRGRSPLDLIELTPGVVDGTGFNTEGANIAGGGVTVNGSRDRAWNYTLDGIDVNETSAGGSNFSPLRTNPDSISEFRVLTSNFTSEYGRNSGGEVIMVTNSGTNKFHGNGFFFYQTPGLLANDPGNKATIPQIPRPQFVQKIYGFSVGGPIIKNKTFFFTNLQLLNNLQTTGITSLVYTGAARNGIYRYMVNPVGCGTTGQPACPFQNSPAGTSGASVDSAGNVLPGVNVNSYNIAANDPQGFGLDSQIQQFIGLTPLPNNFAVGDGLNTAGFSFNAHQFEKQVDLTVKVDHNFNQNNSIFVRWAGGHQNTVGDTVNGGLAPFPNAPNVVDTFRAPRNFAASWRSVLSPVLTNEFLVGMNRFIFNFANPDANFAKNPPFQLCFVSCGDVASPLQNYVGNKRALTTYQLVDNMSYARGAHAFKWGVNFRYQRHIDTRGSIGNFDASPLVNFDSSINSVDPTRYNLPKNINGQTDISNLTNTINSLLGRVGEIDQGLVALNDNQYAPPGGLLHFDFRMPEYDFYGQDSWKLRPNLVVDLGLRWEIKLAPTDPRNVILHPNQPFGFGATPTNTLAWEHGQLYQNSWKDFGPSIGFAWDPWSDGKTSIRANYRLAYDRINTFSLSSSVFQGMPGLTQQIADDNFGPNGGRVRNGIPTEFAPAGTTPLSLRQPSVFSTASNTVIDPHWKPPQVSQWGLSIQREIAPHTVVEMAYIGNHGVHLYGAYDANQVNIFGNGFLNAFKTVQAGGDSPLMDLLLSQDSRLTPGETGSQFLRNDAPSAYTTPFNLGSVAGLATAIAKRTQGGVPLLQLDGVSPFFFFPFPQYGGGLNVLDSHDISSYNALQTQVRHSFNNGLTFQASYVWSKSLDTRSFDPTFTTVAHNSSPFGASSTPFNIADRRLNYAPSDSDRTNVFQSHWVYQLPFGASRRWGGGWNPVFQHILGGWELAGVGIIESGRPTTIYSPANTLTNVVRTPADCAGCSPNMFNVHQDSTGSNNYLTPSQMAQFSTPGPGEFSNVGRNFFRLAGFKVLNLSIGKVTNITETQSLETRIEMQNVTNSEEYDEPASNRINSSQFGNLNPSVLENNLGPPGLASTPRKIQLSVKYSF